MLSIRKGVAAFLLLCVVQCVSAEETKAFMERLQEKESTALEAYTVDAEELMKNPIVEWNHYGYWPPHGWRDWLEAIGGIVLGMGVEIGIAFGNMYPCVG